MRALLTAKRGDFYGLTARPRWVDLTIRQQPPRRSARKGKLVSLYFEAAKHGGQYLDGCAFPWLLLVAQ